MGHETIFYADEPKDSFLKKGFKILTYPVSALIGYSFTKPVIRNSAYDNLRHYNAFSDIRPPHVDRLHSIIERFHRNEPVDVLNETIKEHANFYEQVSTRFNELGLGTLEKQWKFIHKSQRQNALLTGFTAAGISLGALLTAVNSKTLTSLLVGEENER